MNTWTMFYDMHSGGRCKQDPYEVILIEAPEGEARVIFYNRFGRNPERVTCTCCGPDYSISSGELDQITAYERNCDHDLDSGRWVEHPRWVERPVEPLDKYLKREDVLVIPASDIKDDERVGSVPTEG